MQLKEGATTQSNQDAVRKAITRNLFELALAIYERRVLKSIAEYDSNEGVYISGVNFILICHKALFNDMVAHLIKVLDTNPASATFWMIYKYEIRRVKNLSSYTEDKIFFLQKVAKRIKLIRDKTHFHIDKMAVFDPKAIWQEAAITQNEYDRALDYLWMLLTELHLVVFGKGFIERAPDYYKGEDIAGFLDWARSKGLIQ